MRWKMRHLHAAEVERVVGKVVAAGVEVQLEFDALQGSNELCLNMAAGKVPPLML